MLLRPYSHLADDTLPVEDLWTYQKIGAKGTELTGYPNISVFHEFRYHPKEVITGSLDDWMYDHGGVFAWTVEIWSPQRQAGIGEYKFIEWYREHPVEDDLKLLEWNDTVLGGKGFVDWYPFEHPQLGPRGAGRLGHALHLEQPAARAAGEGDRALPEVAGVAAADLAAAGAARSQRRRRSGRTPGGSGWWSRTRAGCPATSPSGRCANKLTRGVVCEIELPQGAQLETGKPREEVGQLEGRAYKPVSPSSWAGWSGDTTDDRAKVEWVVRAPAHSLVRLTAGTSGPGRCGSSWS